MTADHGARPAPVSGVASRDASGATVSGGPSGDTSGNPADGASGGSGVELGPLLESDAQRCADLERVLFPGDDPWPARAFQQAVRDRQHYLAARHGDVLVGYAGVALLGRPPHLEAEIHTIGVDPAWQGRGIGRRLLRALLAVADEHAAPVLLEVRTDNDVAIALYRDAGFEIVNTRRRYYRPSGADAYTMRRPAPGAPIEQVTRPATRRAGNGGSR